MKGRGLRALSGTIKPFHDNKCAASHSYRVEAKVRRANSYRVLGVFVQTNDAAKQAANMGIQDQRKQYSMDRILRGAGAIDQRK